MIQCRQPLMGSFSNGPQAVCSCMFARIGLQDSAQTSLRLVLMLPHRTRKSLPRLQ